MTITVQSQNLVSTKIVISNFREKIFENDYLWSSANFKWWKMFANSLETSLFSRIEVASFKISNPDSVRVKSTMVKFG